MSVVVTVRDGDVRAGIRGVVALGVAAAGWLVSGLLAAIPAGVALTCLAETDLASHRFSLRLLAVASAFMSVALVADAVRLNSFVPIRGACIGVMLTALVLGGVWLATDGLAFGDVLMTTFMVATPAALAWRAMIGALVAATAFAVAHIARRGLHRSSTVPLAPALLGGWMWGLVVG